MLKRNPHLAIFIVLLIVLIIARILEVNNETGYALLSVCTIVFILTLIKLFKGGQNYR